MLSWEWLQICRDNDERKDVAIYSTDADLPQPATYQIDHGCRTPCCVSLAISLWRIRMPQPPALIIIDMQQGMQSATLPPRNNPSAEDMIARLHAAWRMAGYPVVSVRHISRSPDSVFAPGQPGVEFQPRFQPLAHEHVVERTSPMPSSTPASSAGSMRAASRTW